MSDETKPAKISKPPHDPAGPETSRRYPRAAYEFVSEGLAYSVRKIHGPESAAHHLLGAFMARNGLDPSDLVSLMDEGKLPPPIVAAIKQVGGPEKLNRHIGGRDLAWGLREYALTRWGMLARSVLERWNIRQTVDFGQIVFETIEEGRMQKQPGDTLDDFKDVFDFEEAFDAVFRVGSDERPSRASGRTAGRAENDRAHDDCADDNGPDDLGDAEDRREASAAGSLHVEPADATDTLDELCDDDDAFTNGEPYAQEDDDDPTGASQN